MRITLNIEDELYLQVETRAAFEGRSVTELVEEGLRALLERALEPSSPARTIDLPLVPAPAEGEPLFAGMQPEEVCQALADLQSEIDLERSSAG